MEGLTICERHGCCHEDLMGQRKVRMIRLQTALFWVRRAVVVNRVGCRCTPHLKTSRMYLAQYGEYGVVMDQAKGIDGLAGYVDHQPH